MKLPDYIDDLPEDQVQPYTVQEQGPYVAIIQWDGAGEQQHWVLIPKTEVGVFISKLLEVP